LREWVLLPEVLTALKLTVSGAQKWRCKSARAFDWEDWAVERKLQILPKDAILKAGDIVIYTKSHIEIISDDDGTPRGPFVAIGYNTNAAGSRDGEGCFEKPRNRSGVKCFIRILA
jgi:hypothetical protein